MVSVHERVVRPKPVRAARALGLFVVVLFLTVPWFKSTRRSNLRAPRSPAHWLVQDVSASIASESGRIPSPRIRAITRVCALVAALGLAVALAPLPLRARLSLSCLGAAVSCALIGTLIAMEMDAPLLLAAGAAFSLVGFLAAVDRAVSTTPTRRLADSATAAAILAAVALGLFGESHHTSPHLIDPSGASGAAAIAFAGAIYLQVRATGVERRRVEL